MDRKQSLPILTFLHSRMGISRLWLLQERVPSVRNI